MRRVHRFALHALACASLLCACAAPRAWDAARMSQAAQRIGAGAVAGVRELQAMLNAARELDEASRLSAVNRFYNHAIRFATDAVVWSQPDHWASPLETLGRGEGDCEDYAIAKYFSLRALGVPSARLRLVYVRLQQTARTSASEPHMVLAWYASPDAEPLILDNLVGEVMPASRRPDLEPVFSFNSEGLWQGTGARAAGDPVARLSRWREVLNKARAEGFL